MVQHVEVRDLSPLFHTNGWSVWGYTADAVSFAGMPPVAPQEQPPAVTHQLEQLVSRDTLAAGNIASGQPLIYLQAVGRPAAWEKETPERRRTILETVTWRAELPRLDMVTQQLGLPEQVVKHRLATAKALLGSHTPIGILALARIAGSYTGEKAPTYRLTDNNEHNYTALLSTRQAQIGALATLGLTSKSIAGILAANPGKNEVTPNPKSVYEQAERTAAKVLRAALSPLRMTEAFWARGHVALLPPHQADQAVD